MLDPSTLAYNQQLPIEMEVLTEHVQNGAIIRDITYSSPRGGKVPAYLILPEQQQPQAGLIFGHWGAGDRTEFVDEARVLTRLGMASLCLDAPMHRPVSYGGERTQPQTEMQWITDVRRAVDLLQDMFSLSPEQTGYVGHSYGATFGGVVAGIEHRISAFVLMAGWYAMSELMRTSTVPVLVKARSEVPPEVFSLYIKAMEPLDAMHYIKQAPPSHLFFQFANHDTSVLPDDGQKFFDLASEPKQISWYDNCSHELSSQARLDRIVWLCATLQIKQPSQAIIEQLLHIPAPVPLQD